ncbi:TetR/AcrR family transcriptional regulator [Spirillospora sp. CA-294931]|uniref:TetR/AcrR family transcriptional regulator n=1 Tax=Spirillospora sp. CA-294931 TaxID=3240042 RepID=UPI003D920E2C
MSDSSPRRLPRGRHALPREEARRLQRLRLCGAMAEVMSEKGYVATSVEDVLKRAVVSRQSFYQLFDSKFDCFMSSFERASELLLERLIPIAGFGSEPAQTEGAEPLERFERAFTAYLEALASEWSYTRLFLVEVYAAGPDAVRRRTDVQSWLADALADLLGARSEEGRFACRTVVAATSAMVTAPVARNDREGLLAVGPPLIAHVRRLWAAGVLT